MIGVGAWRQGVCRVWRSLYSVPGQFLHLMSISLVELAEEQMNQVNAQYMWLWDLSLHK